MTRDVTALTLSYPAQRVYDTLVSLVGATDDESNRLQWEHFWKERGDYREYRFIGNLGFGGKFYSAYLQLLRCIQDDPSAPYDPEASFLEHVDV